MVGEWSIWQRVMVVKTLTKAKLCRDKWAVQSKVQSLQNESDILVHLKGSKWFTEIFFAKDRQNYLYLGLEFCQAGNLLNLQNERKLTNNQSNFLIIEIIIAAKELPTQARYYPS